MPRIEPVITSVDELINEAIIIVNAFVGDPPIAANLTPFIDLLTAVHAQLSQSVDCIPEDASHISDLNLVEHFAESTTYALTSQSRDMARTDEPKKIFDISHVLFINEQDGCTYDANGDYHGYAIAFLAHLKETNFFRNPAQHKILLGDYIDRGERSLLTVVMMLLLQRDYPDRFHMLAGNHEALFIRPDFQLLMYGHLNFLNCFFNNTVDFTKNTAELVFFPHTDIHQQAYNLLSNIFSKLPTTAYLIGKNGDNTLFTHGGLPINYELFKTDEDVSPQSITLKTLLGDPKTAMFGDPDAKFHPDYNPIHRALQRDEEMREGTLNTPRLYGYFWGNIGLNALATAMNIKYMVHGHLHQQLTTTKDGVQVYCICSAGKIRSDARKSPSFWRRNAANSQEPIKILPLFSKNLHTNLNYVINVLLPVIPQNFSSQKWKIASPQLLRGPTSDELSRSSEEEEVVVESPHPERKRSSTVESTSESFQTIFAPTLPHITEQPANIISDRGENKPLTMNP
jgi:hypothetical protein